MATLTNRPTDRITLRIDPSRKSEFLRMLKLFDFVEVEPLEKQVKQYVKDAPKEVPLTDEDIQAEINVVRRARKRL
ncbi:hypothetical protein [Rudanella lutea]|uniref:hypothetical protein n=1 Tax=Rudanella lutea TaxID=451374 RepID=UPI00035CF383|nr:hypothetical protein [Rudanella lutea]